MKNAKLIMARYGYSNYGYLRGLHGSIVLFYLLNEEKYKEKQKYFKTFLCYNVNCEKQIN